MLHLPACWLPGLPTMQLLAGWVRPSLISMVKHVFMVSLSLALALVSGAESWGWAGRQGGNTTCWMLGCSELFVLPSEFSMDLQGDVSRPPCDWPAWPLLPELPSSLGQTGGPVGCLAIAAFSSKEEVLCSAGLMACWAPALAPEGTARAGLSPHRTPVGKSTMCWA